MDKSGSLQAGEKLRTLGTLEEFYWLQEQYASRVIVVYAEVEGATNVEDWRRALVAVQAKHPLLSVGMGKVQGARPFLKTLPAAEIPLRLAPLGDKASILNECRSEMATTFGDGSGVPIRATLLHGAERSVLILAVHHAILDGLGVINLVRDTLRAVSGEKLEPTQPLFPPFDELVGLPPAPEYVLSENRPVEAGLPRTVPRKPPIKQIFLRPEITFALAERARHEGATVNGAITAAILLAGRRNSDVWATETIRCLQPVNGRSVVEVDGADGVLIGPKMMTLEPDSKPEFWDLARSVNSGLDKLRTREGLAAGLGMFRQFVSAERTPSELLTMLSARPNHLMLSNMGRFQNPTTFGSLRLKSLCPLGDSGIPGTQTITVATVDGLMSIAQISHEPIPFLLEETKALLINPR